MASVVSPEGSGAAVVEGSAAIVQRLAPFAAAIGSQLATMRLPQNMAANAASNFPGWTNVTARATADNSLPTDTTPSKLRLPTTLERTESGIAIYAVRDDVAYAPIFFNYGHDTGDAGVEYQLVGLAGESLNVQVRYPDDGGAPYVAVKVATGPLGENVDITVSMAQDVGVVKAALEALQGSLAHLQNEYQQLAGQGQSGQGQGGQGGVPVVTTALTSLSLQGRTVTLDWMRNGQVQPPLTVNLPATHTFELVHDSAGLAAADTADTLLATAAIASTTFVAGDILAYNTATSAWVKIINLGSTAHVIANGSIDIHMLSSALQTTLGNLLTLASVDQEVRKLVEAFSLKAGADRIPEKRLPLKLDNFIDALSGGTWSDSTTGRVAISSVADPANIEAFPFATQLSGPRYTNDWYATKLPENDSLSLRRIAVGEAAVGYWQLLPASTWTEREHNGGFRYFTVPFADLPASSTVRVQELTPFELDHEILGLVAFTEQERTALLAALDNPLPVATAQQVGYVPKVGANLKYALAEIADDVRQGTWETDANGNAVINPAPGDVPSNVLLEVGQRLYINGVTRWIEIAEAQNVVQKGDETYPAHVVTPNAELANSRFQVENYANATRNDQTLRFDGWTDQFISSGTPPTQRNYGAAHATALPAGFNHATYYPTSYPVPGLAGKIIITASPQLVAFDPRTLHIRKSGEAVGAERTLNVTPYTQRRGGRDVFLGYQVTPAASDRPTKTGSTDFVLNVFNASANYLYLTEASSTEQYVSWSQLAPRQIGAASAAFLSRLRAAGNNAWAAVTTNPNALGGLLRGNFPAGYRVQFIVKLGTSTTPIYSDWIEAEELTSLAALANTSTARVIRRQIASVNDIPTENYTSTANCLQLAARGFAFLWVGFIGDRLTASSDHANLWIAGSEIKVRIKPF